jgi:hypothetical protein
MAYVGSRPISPIPSILSLFDRKKSLKDSNRLIDAYWGWMPTNDLKDSEFEKYFFFRSIFLEDESKSSETEYT